MDKSRLVRDNEILTTKLYNEDCLNTMKKFIAEGVKMDLVVTDPPYKIVEGGCSNEAVTINALGGILNKHKGNNIELVKKGKIFEHNEIQFKEWLPLLYEVLKDGSHCYIMINARNLAELQLEAEKVGFIFHNILIWDKGTATPNKWYMQSAEFILFLRKGAAKNINNMGSKTVIRTPNVKRNFKRHPTEKPVRLMKLFIDNSSKKGDLVFDPFMGVGPTGEACKELDRNFIGVEIDKHYYSLAKQGIENHKTQQMFSV